MLIYPFSAPVFGQLQRRYKRFFADVELDSGEVVTAHCPNTGPMTGVCVPGARVFLSHSPNPKRKLAYTWEAIELATTVPGFGASGSTAGPTPPRSANHPGSDDHSTDRPNDLSDDLSHDRQPAIDAGMVWVGVNTSLPNRVVKLLLGKVLARRSTPVLVDAIDPSQADRLAGGLVCTDPDLSQLSDRLGAFSQIRSEVKYGSQSRVDFVLDGGDRSIYLEVKNTTWTAANLALFPDTETTRGQKHLRDLTDLLPESRAIGLYFIHRADCDRFAPGDDRDPEYGRLLRLGRDRGLEILPLRMGVTPLGVAYLGLATCDFA